MIEEITITSLSGRGSVVLKTRDAQGYWLGPVDWGQVQGQHQTYSYYNQVGASIVSTSVLSRSLSITGWVVEGNGNSLQARCDFLNGFFSPVEDYTLAYRNRKIQFRPDTSVVYSREFTKNNELIRKFMIQATCPHPLFSDLTDTVAPFDYSGKRFRFPSDFGQEAPVVFATTEKAYRVGVNNTGGFQIGLLVALSFSGDVKNPRIKNLTTGKFIGVTRTFHKGERLELSTVPGNKRITLHTAAGETENLIKHRDYRMSWIQLEPGENLLALDCDELDQRNSMTVTVYFTPLYLEVE